MLSFFSSEFKADDHALKQNSTVKAQTCQVLLYTAHLLLNFPFDTYHKLAQLQVNECEKCSMNIKVDYYCFFRFV